MHETCFYHYIHAESFLLYHTLRDDCNLLEIICFVFFIEWKVKVSSEGFLVVFCGLFHNKRKHKYKTVHLDREKIK